MTATSLNGFNQAINLGVSGLPSGATPGFNPTSLTPPPNGQASSTLTITTTSGVQTGTFNLNVQGTSGSLSHSATPSLTVATPAQLLQTFTTCAGSGNATSCILPILPANTYYYVAQTIVIGHSNVTISGGSMYPSQTVLVRAPACTPQPSCTKFTGPLMRVNAASPLTGVTIQNLAFCGSNTITGDANPLVCPSPQQTDCTTACADLSIDNADSGYFPVSPDPFHYTGPYSVTITNCDFEGATGHAIRFTPAVAAKSTTSTSTAT